MTQTSVPTWRGPIGWIMLAILVWALVLAGGVLLYDYRSGQVNWWKPTIIVTAAWLFVCVWLVALRQRRRSA